MDDSNFIRLEGDDFGNKFRFNYYCVDYNFLSEYKFNLIAGRPFQIEKSSDVSSALIVNESGAKDLGFISPEEAIGKRIIWQQRPYEIIGITKNFHYSGLKSQIEPFFFVIFPFYKYITFTIDTNYIGDTIQFLEAQWKDVFPGIPFEYFFLDDDIYRLYLSEERTARIVGTFSLLSLVIACLGIFGLISYTVEQKTKEIGIRKVLVSSLMRIVILLSKNLLTWILLAILISWPIAWYLVNKWLQNFFYRIKIGFDVFFVAGLIVFIISLFSMSFKTITAANANPVDSLKYE
jgi:putative ABC transport system permease protein